MRVACSLCLGQEDPVLLEARAFGDERITFGVCASHRREALIGRYVRMLERRGHP
jgi:hypothetical protein